MVIALLVLILFAILFPKFLRFVFGLVALAGLYVLASAAGHADELDAVPRYPVDQICSSRFPAGNPGRGYCVSQEQSSYDVVAMVWGRVPSGDRARCADTAQKQPMWNYTYLFSCVDAALKRQEVEHLRTPKSFQY